MSQIAFGTSGWRGLVAEDFTFPNVRAATQAIVDYLRESGGSEAPIVVAYDTRFLGEEFAHAVSEVCAGNGFQVIHSSNPLPTPAVAWEILQRKAAGAINVTASHNPYRWNGLKFNPASAGPALPEMTDEIEKRANTIIANGTEIRRATSEQWKDLVSEEALGDAYREQLRRLVDLERLGKAGLRIAADPLYGTAIGFLDQLLREASVDLIVQHAERDPYFGGGRPEPEGESLELLANLVRREKAILGLATDCDADRFGIVDSDGTHVLPNQVLSLLVGYLAETRGWSGKAVGRSVATTHLLDAAARAAGLSVVETPVGFKYLGSLLTEGKIVMGGEESGGFSIAGHVPDKDGILTCLLVAEMVASRGVSLREQLADLFDKVGPRHTMRRDLPWPGGKGDLDKRMEGVGTELAGTQIESVSSKDGKKFLLEDGSWVLARASGTEPIIRIYVEATSESRVSELLTAFSTVLGIV